MKDEISAHKKIGGERKRAEIWLGLGFCPSMFTANTAAT
jgi:hypothetical protein